MDLRQTASPQSTSRQSTSPQSNEGMGRGMEFAVLVLVFLGAGYGLDRWLGTKPVFMIIFVMLAIVGQFASLYYGYNQRMKDLEAKRAESASSGKAMLS